MFISLSGEHQYKNTQIIDHAGIVTQNEYIEVAKICMRWKTVEFHFLHLRQNIWRILKFKLSEINSINSQQNEMPSNKQKINCLANFW